MFDKKFFPRPVGKLVECVGIGGKNAYISTSSAVGNLVTHKLFIIKIFIIQLDNYKMAYVSPLERSCGIFSNEKSFLLISKL